MKWLLALKLGLFAPTSYGLVLPYVSADIVKPTRLRPGIEIGTGLDMVDRRGPQTINGQPVRRLSYTGAAFAGLSFPVQRSASFGIGLKYRPDGSDFGGYIGASVRLKLVDWGQPTGEPRRRRRAENT